VKYADVILPLAVPLTYTFGVPVELQSKIAIGCRVEVQFGKRKIYSGLVKNLHNHKPDVYEVKPIRGILDIEPIATADQLKFWEWVASYYACTEGEVMNAALPSFLKLVSETCVVINDDIVIDELNLTDEEFMVLQALDIKRENKTE
jgi:primosomal protein N' (replication factor Y)